jgi:hypothetical protein
MYRHGAIEVNASKNDHEQSRSMSLMFYLNRSTAKDPSFSLAAVRKSFRVYWTDPARPTIRSSPWNFLNQSL